MKQQHPIATTPSPTKLCQFKCLDVIDSPASPLLDDSCTSVVDGDDQQHGTLITQVELIIANTGERILDMNNTNVPPTLTSWNDFGSFIADRLKLQTTPLIINGEGYAPHRLSSCLQQFKKSNRFYIIIPEIIEDQLLLNYQRDQSKEYELVESCKIQFESLEVFLKYIEIIQQKYANKLEEIHKKLDECKNMKFDHVSDVIVDKKFGGKSLIEYFKEPEKNLSLFNEKIFPKYKELKQMLSQKFTSSDLQNSSQDIIIRRKNVTDEFYRICSYTIKFSVSFSNLKLMVDRFYPRIKALSSLDRTYELTILELHERNKFRNILSTTIDEINSFIKEENERRNYFIDLITEDSNYSLVNISTIIPCVEQTVNYVNKSSFITPDLSLSDDTVNELVKKHSHSLQKFKIKYSDIDDSLENSSEFSFVKTFSFVGSTKNSKELTELNQKNTELNLKLSEIRQQNLAYEKQIEDLNSSLESEKQTNQETNSKLDTVMKENEELRKLLEEHKRSSESHSKLIAEEQLKASDLMRSLTEKELELEIYQKNVHISEDVMKEAADLKKKLELSESKLKTQLVQITSLEDEVKDFESKHKQLLADIDLLKQGNTTQKESLDENLKTINSLKEEKRNLVENLESAKKQLEKSQKSLENLANEKEAVLLSNCEHKELFLQLVPHLNFLLQLIDQLAAYYLQIEGGMDLHDKKHTKFTNAYLELRSIRDATDKKLKQICQLAGSESVFSELGDICDISELVAGLLSRWENISKLLK